MELFLCLLALLAGAGVFIAGMNMMSSGLEKSAGAGLKNLLRKLSSNKLAGIGMGALVTAIIHSSAATSVMVIGLVNAEVMSLAQAVTIIMGANIGTTITGLMISLSSLNINIYFSALAFVGIMMNFSKKSKVKNIGNIIAGLGIIFIGLELMGDAFDNEAVNQMIMNVFSVVDFPLLLILIGMVFTALLQSSTAMTGLIIVMVQAGTMPVSSGLFIILGTNIGTCLSALLSTVGANVNAKRTGLIHLLFNVFGTILFTIVLWIFQEPIVSLLNSIIPNLALQIALFHFTFNLVTALILLPFTKQLCLITEHLIKDTSDEKKKSVTKYIDDRLLGAPSIAVVEAKNEIGHMFELAKSNFELSFDDILNNKIDNKEKITEVEANIDYLNLSITEYLIKLSGLLDEITNKKIGSYFHVVNDIERVGDHAQNFSDVIVEMKEKEIRFSDEAIIELRDLYNKIEKMFDLTERIFIGKEYNLIEEVDSLEDQVDNIKDVMTASHYERLAKNNCSIELGAYYTSIINAIERIADHLVNVSHSVINPTGDQEK